jgi:hypothetical protein
VAKEMKINDAVERELSLDSSEVETGRLEKRERTRISEEIPSYNHASEVTDGLRKDGDVRWGPYLKVPVEKRGRDLSKG